RNLTVTNITTSSVFLTWDKPIGNRYFFQIYWTYEKTNRNLTETSNTFYNITDLTAGVNYTFCITAVAADKSIEGETFCILQYTNVIRNLKVSEITTSSVFLIWEEPFGNRYFFKLNWTDGKTSNHVITNNTWYNITGLTAGVNYTFNIAAVAADKSTEGGSVVTSNYTNPDVIRNLIVSNITTTSVFLTWEEPVGNRSFFKLKWADDKTSGNSTETTNTSYQITGLTAGVNYTFCITAVTTDKSTKGETVCSSQITNVIRNLRVSEITTSSVFLIWEEPFGNRYFFKLNWTDGKTSNHVITNNTWYNITGLTAGVNYTFNIAAVAADKSTEGGSVVTSNYTNPDVIRNLTVSNITTSSVFLTWEEPAGNRSFFKLKWADDKTSGNSTETTDTSYQITGLTAGVNYTFCITAVTADKSTKGETVCSSQITSMQNSKIHVSYYKAHLNYLTLMGGCSRHGKERVSLSIYPFDDYINANCIPGYNSRKEFIAAQGPLPVTVNEFWRMVWEKNVYTIVMLTKCNEMGRVKCEKYWPSGTNHFHNISVTTTSEIELESWTIRDFRIKNVKTAESRYVRQFHFTAWPDHGVPQTTEVLIDFRHLVREHMEQYSRHSPTVVHCSAGVGKTGTFIAIDHLIFQIEKDSMVDIYGIVNDMRMHRPLMVQTELVPPLKSGGYIEALKMVVNATSF
uniref:Protein tyrosine phosphatase receptor type Jb, tandem duplicate 1 n=1 Tax=Cyprinus carpio TaxID=7962 RepID=A0A8C1JBS1_CYPCA